MQSSKTILGHPLFWLILALVVRLLYLVEQSRTSVLFYHPTLDEAELAQTAGNLLAGKGFGTEPLFKAPLYPLFLAGCMKVGGLSWFWLVRFLQHLCGALLVGMGFDVARRLAGSRNSSWLAGAVTAGLLVFYAPLIRLENRMVLDFMVVFLQSGMLWALVRDVTEPEPSKRTRWIAIAGLFAALAWLNRPTLTPLLPMLALFVFLTTQPGAFRPARGMLLAATCRALLFIVLPACSMGTVYLRNATTGQEAMLLPWQGGYAFYHANRPGVTGRYYKQDRLSLSQNGNPTYELMVEGYQAAVDGGEAPAPASGKFYHAVNAYWFDESKAVIKADISTWLRHMVRKGFYLVSAREVYNFEAFEIHRHLSRWLRLMPFNFGWLWPLAFASIPLFARSARAQRPLLALMWMYILLLGAAIALYYTSGRLRMPLVFPAAALAGFFMHGLLQHRPWRNKMIAGMGVAAFLLTGWLMSWGDWWGVRSEVVAHYDWARLSDAAWKQGQHEKALDYMQRAEAIMPEYPLLPGLKGQALISLGRTDEAEKAFRRALTTIPADPTPAFNLGFIRYYHRKDPSGAVSFFSEAFRRNPAGHRSQWYAALCHLRMGDPASARAILQVYIDAPQERPPMLQVAVIGLLCAENQVEQARATYRQWTGNVSADLAAQADAELKLLNPASCVLPPASAATTGSPAP